MRLDPSRTIFVGGYVLIALQVLVAWSQNMLTPTQMKLGGRLQGLPLIAHGGIWGDLYITALVAYIAARYEHQWSTFEWTVALAVGAIASVGMHYMYTLGTTPEAHVRDGRLTLAGWIHALYMAVALAVLILFYLTTDPVSKQLMWFSTVLLIVHVMIGNHFVLGWIDPPWYPDRPLRNPIGWATVIVCAVILVIATHYRVAR